MPDKLDSEDDPTIKLADHLREGLPWIALGLALGVLLVTLVVGFELYTFFHPPPPDYSHSL